VSEGHGIDGATGALVRGAGRHPGIAAVYSIGGGNAAIVQAFAQAGRPCQVFIGHDLDADNVALLKSGAIQAVLHHDLGQDMRRACQEVLRAQGRCRPCPSRRPVRHPGCHAVEPARPDLRAPVCRTGLTAVRAACHTGILQ
jgi:LacI family transcriptional regulator